MKFPGSGEERSSEVLRWRNRWGDTQAQALELAVIVLPLTPGSDLFGRVPMLHQFAVGDSKEIIEGGMNPAEVALADTQHEIALGQNTMEPLIVDASAALVRRLQCDSQRGYPSTRPGLCSA